MKENRFNRFKFQPFIIEAMNEFGFSEPTEIQERMIPLVLKRESAIGQSQTGTGKTFAYVLPILERIDPNRKEVQAVITAPTRELASQIYHQILKITEHCNPDHPIMTRCYIGGTDKQRTIDKLKVQPHIVVGTPSRIKDLMIDQALFVHTSEILVVDEADMMLDMGFIEDLDHVAAKMPENLQMLVFSATIPEKLKPFLKKYMENPKTVQIESQKGAAENLQHFLLPSRHRSKKQLVHDALLTFNPYLAIVFTNTKKMAEDLANFLTAKGLKVGRVHGDLNPRERRKMMKQIQDLDYQYIVATDLASRGIDIEGVSHIINYELPTDLDFYIHRVGRTARAGNSGIALTIYEASDEDALNRLEKMGISFEYVDLKENEFVKVDARNKRKTRVRQEDAADKQAKSMIRKPSKVKPGYKKKMQWEMDKIKKRQRRIDQRKK
jgi:ATP-dependent RNA helicase CshB